MEERLRFNFYLVESKGLKQQFSSELLSRRLFTKLKKAAMQEEAAFVIKMFGRNELTEDWALLEEVQIEEAYYD